MKKTYFQKKISLVTCILLLPISTTVFADGQNLLDIYHLAISKDPTLASARSSNKAVQEKLVQGKALYRPTVTFDAKADHSETDISYTGSNSIFKNGGRQSFETHGYGINVNQPLFRKQNIVQNQQAKTLVTQSDKQLALAQQDLMIRVSQAYFDFLLARDKIDLTVAQKAAIDRQLEQAKANFEVGTATITDVNEAQAKHDLVQAQEIAARNELEIKKRAIQSITGEAPEKLIAVKSDLAPTNPEPNDIEKWVEIAEQNSLAIQIQQQALELANQEIDRNQAGHLPTLDAVASYNDNRANGGVNGFGNNLQSTVVGLQFQIPIYQGGLVSSKVREAVALKQKAQDDLEVARRKADLDTRQAYLNLTSSVAQVNAYQQALVSSQSQLDSTNLGYEVGVRTSVDVLNAQQQLFSAKRDLLQARYQYLLSILQLKFASGLIAENDLAEINQQFNNLETTDTETSVVKTENVPDAVDRKSSENTSSATNEYDIDDINSAVKAWADAWSTKNIDKYFASYADDFEPPQAQTREAWQQTRRQRILKPDPISVEVGDIEISTLDEMHKNVRFKQVYNSGKISERNIKNLVMKKSDGVWLIVKETSAPI